MQRDEEMIIIRNSHKPYFERNTIIIKIKAEKISLLHFPSLFYKLNINKNIMNNEKIKILSSTRKGEKGHQEEFLL